MNMVGTVLCSFVNMYVVVSVMNLLLPPCTKFTLELLCGVNA